MNSDIGGHYLVMFTSKSYSKCPSELRFWCRFMGNVIGFSSGFSGTLYGQGAHSLCKDLNNSTGNTINPWGNTTNHSYQRATLTAPLPCNFI